MIYSSLSESKTWVTEQLPGSRNSDQDKENTGKIRKPLRILAIQGMTLTPWNSTDSPRKNIEGGGPRAFALSVEKRGLLVTAPDTMRSIGTTITDLSKRSINPEDQDEWQRSKPPLTTPRTKGRISLL